MATPHWDYPNSGSPTDIFTFLSAEFFPVEAQDVPIQKVGRSISGKFKVATISTTPRKVLPLSFKFARANLSDFQTFIRDKAEFAGNTFDFTDSRGTVHTVRLVDGEVKYPEQTYNMIRGIVNLEYDVT